MTDRLERSAQGGFYEGPQKEHSVSETLPGEHMIDAESRANKRQQGQRAVELLPMEKDAIGGRRIIVCLARIAAWVGENDLACQQLAVVIRSPSGLSYGALKLLPFWDPLRGDPRFEKLVEEAKQPFALKAAP